MKKGGTFAKRALATACSAAMAVALVPAAAFAADDAAADAAAADTAAETVLKVQTEAVDAEGNEMSEPVDVKSYTQAELDSLAAANTTTQHYEYAGRNGATVVSTSSYVTIDQLASDAGVTQWGAGSSLSFVCSDGPYTKASPTYEDATAGYYYPNYSVSEYDATGKVQVPAAITLTSKKDSLEVGATAADVVTNSTAAESSEDSPMFVIGTQDSTYEGKAVNQGRMFPTGVNTIIVKYQPTVTVQTQAVDAEGNAMSDPTTVKSYTLSELGDMAKTNTTTLRYEYGGHGAGQAGTLLTTSKYVTIDQLMSDAKVTQWGAGASLGFECYDGPYGKYTASYEEAEGGYYFPNYTVTELDKNGATQVPATLMLASKRDSTEPGTTAAETAANSTGSETTENCPRYAMGTLNTATSMNMGRTFPSGVNTIIVKYQPTVTVQTARVEQGTNSKGITVWNPVSGTEKTVKTYTLSELNELAKANTTTMHYQYGGNKGDTLVTTSSYVTASQLLQGIPEWKDGAVLSYAASDGFSGTQTYADVTSSSSYYFPSYSSGNFDTAGETAVPAALSLKYKKDTIESGTTAADTAAASTKEESSESTPMFVIGESESAYKAGSLLRGNNFVTGIVTLTVGYTESTPTPTPTPTPSVTKTANTLTVGKKAVTVKKGKTAKVAVKKAKGKVTVKSSSKKIAKVSYSSKTKKVTIKGVKKGKATITVKAAGNSKYKAGSKTIKVTVKK